MLHNEFMEWPFYIMFYLIVSFYGLCIGSFLNVVIFRLPKDESLVKRASHCMTCGTKILWRDNIPVLGWLMLKGKCRSCGEPISKRYPIVESLNCIIYLIAFTVLDFSLQTILYCFFFSALICIAFIDWDTQEMDLRVLLFIAVLAIPDIILSVIQLTSPDTFQHLPKFVTDSSLSLSSHFIGAVCIGLPFFLIGELSKPIIEKIFGERFRAIELGDTILMAVGGLLIGWKATVISAFFGVCIAAVCGVILKKINGESKFAFGPYLAIGLYLGTLFGEKLLDWYIAWVTYDPTQAFA
ncbi:MAG: prepilin peptidase [Oscillospiraceae bacterium]|nr:prepilin peptidase [Oscillospiraceae bacterium]MBR7084706.1 prepilin peptidase [Oscillospiraceae bacterium]